jgi:large subunit ribosomal protein L25
MINVLHRDLNEKTKAIRKRGYIPAVIYGRQLDNSIPIELYKTDFKRLLEAGKNTEPIDLNLNGEIKKCVITHVDVDAVKDMFLHIDFKLI